MRRAVVTWGRQWPAVLTPNVKPAPGPVIVRRATTYSVLVSSNGSHWRLLTTVTGRTGTTDTLTFRRQKIRFIRLQIASATNSMPPLLEELKLTG